MSNETNQNTKIYYSDNVKRLTDTNHLQSTANMQHTCGFSTPTPDEPYWFSTNLIKTNHNFYKVLPLI